MEPVQESGEQEGPRHGAEWALAVVWKGAAAPTHGVGLCSPRWTRTWSQTVRGVVESPHLLLVFPCRSLGPGVTIT